MRILNDVANSGNKNSRSLSGCFFCLVAQLGLEPRLTVPKTAVLPLDDRAKSDDKFKSSFHYEQYPRIILLNIYTIMAKGGG